MPHNESSQEGVAFQFMQKYSMYATVLAVSYKCAVHLRLKRPTKHTHSSINIH